MMSKKRTSRLTTEQIEIVAQFADYAFDYPRLSFDAVVKKIMPQGSGSDPRAKEFRRRTKAVFGGSVWESNPPPWPRRTGSMALKATRVTGPLSPPLR